MLLIDGFGRVPEPHDRIESISRNSELDATDLGGEPHVMPSLMLRPKPLVSLALFTPRADHRRGARVHRDVPPGLLALRLPPIQPAVNRLALPGNGSACALDIHCLPLF